MTTSTNNLNNWAKGNRVYVSIDGEEYRATIESTRKSRDGKRILGYVITVDGEESTRNVPAKDITAECKRGRASLVETLDEDELAGEVVDLLNELRAAMSQDEKKRIRRALRRRGHVGGLGGIS